MLFCSKPTKKLLINDNEFKMTYGMEWKDGTLTKNTQKEINSSKKIVSLQ